MAKDYEQLFFDMTDEEREELDKYANVTKKYSNDVKTWDSANLYWGVVGSGHDVQHALELIVKASTEEEAQSAVDEYNACVKTSKKYRKEIKRRMKAKEGTTC